MIVYLTFIFCQCCPWLVLVSVELSKHAPKHTFESFPFFEMRHNGGQRNAFWIIGPFVKGIHLSSAEYPSKMPVIWGFNVYFVVSLGKLLNKRFCWINQVLLQAWLLSVWLNCCREQFAKVANECRMNWHLRLVDNQKIWKWFNCTYCFNEVCFDDLSRVA